MKRQYYLLILIIILTILASSLSDNIIKIKIHIDPSFIIKLSGYPSIGKWMLNEEFKPADWLRHKYEGKLMHEPINVILIDTMSKSVDDAIGFIINSCSLAGFSSKSGHSFEYRGYIGGYVYKQMPYGFGYAFSDNRFTNNNNHGRIFGPYQYNNKYYFIASFSREDFIKDFHVYDSFVKARDDFSIKMNEETDYKVIGKIKLQNHISEDDPKLTTGDHDGYAIVLRTNFRKDLINIGKSINK